MTQGALLGGVAVLVLGAGAMALAQNEEQQGRIVQIGPADDDNNRPVLPPPGGDLGAAQQLIQPGFPEAQPAMPKYWIGLVGGPVPPELRAHVDIPEDQGLLVREVVPNSPAAKAGLKMYDVLLRANDTQLTDMRELIDLVRTEGEQQGQITLEILHRGQREAIWVQPEERPETIVQAPGQGGENFQGPGRIPMLDEIPELRGLFGDLNGQVLRGEGAPFEFRQFGPGVIVRDRFGFADLPDGVSVSIRKENDQPAHITVQRGGETWEVVGDDPESLQQLPEDLRPFVQQMLQGNGPVHLGVQAGDLDRDGGAEMWMGPPNFDDRPLRRRLEAIEKQLQDLLKRQADTTRPSGEEAK